MTFPIKEVDFMEIKCSLIEIILCAFYHPVGLIWCANKSELTSILQSGGRLWAI